MTHLLAMILQAAPAQPSGIAALMRLLFPMIGFVFIFYFMMIRPQQKRQQEHMAILGALKKGDEVITDGGIIATVVHLTDDRVTIKTAENTRLVVLRSKIARVVPPTGAVASTGDAQ
ncbi:MAG TPA: preprotein translocase subunit YajC [Longimicrobiales bacterium]|nr:preprotein translocase subunit YajC [Longimicrobiales bacterium]